MYLFAFGNRRQPCISVKHVLKCSNAICEWPELSISIKSVVLYCIVLYCIESSTAVRSNAVVLVLLIGYFMHRCILCVRLGVGLGRPGLPWSRKKAEACFFQVRENSGNLIFSQENFVKYIKKSGISDFKMFQKSC